MALALGVVALALFPRVLTAVGAPGIIKFAHFGFAISFVALIAPRIESETSKRIVVGLMLLLCVLCLSALTNGAGMVNALLDFLLLSEPFLLLLLLIDEPVSPAEWKRFRLALFAFAAIHVAFAYYQTFVLGYPGDDVKGVFLEQGAGHHVGGAVALTAAIYLFARSGITSTFLRTALAACFAAVVVFSDSKQVLAVFLLSLWALSFTRFANLRRLMAYSVIGLVAVGGFVWAATTVWPALSIWLDMTRISVGVEQKLSVFSLMDSYRDSPSDWLVGLGPGHSVGRLGKILPVYYEDFLGPLGATMSPLTGDAHIANQNHWISNSETGSSIWALFFFWAGVWGDLGLLGTAVFLYLWFVVWRHLCVDDLSRFFVLNIMIFGAVYSWLEEPGYMLLVVAFIGLQWQAHHVPDSVEPVRRLP